MMELLRALFLMLIVCFCVFRVAESDWRHTFLPELAGYVLAGIGSFWLLCVYAHLIFLRALTEVNFLAELMFYFGIALIMWSYTGFRRTRPDRRQAGRPVMAHGLQVIENREERAA
jgi:hypothetical protein